MGVGVPCFCVTVALFDCLCAIVKVKYVQAVASSITGVDGSKFDGPMLGGSYYCNRTKVLVLQRSSFNMTC